jgi:hypothetical protein
MKSIIMGPESILAILDGRKRMTRRVIKPQPPEDDTFIGPEMYAPTVIDRYGNEDAGPEIFGIYGPDGDWGIRCPYVVGDRLYVKEVFRAEDIRPAVWSSAALRYKADDCVRHVNFDEYEDWGKLPLNGRWRSPIFMPRWASRFLLEITSLRAERVQDITTADIIREGVTPDRSYLGSANQYRHAFQDLWDRLNAKRGHPWEANDLVWVIGAEFCASMVSGK